MEKNNVLSVKSLSADEINKIEEFRRSKQTAILAILFSDIADSTHATEKLGEQTYSKLRHIHDELFKRIMCRDNAGIIIKEIGDSFLCVFAEPSTAVLRAVEFQRAIKSNRENLTVQDYTLTVKIGIHVGQVAVENSLTPDIFGRHVNRAARIEALAGGGQILTSQAIWENAAGWLKDNNEQNIAWIAYGKAKLKGIDEPVDIYGFYPKETGKPRTPKLFLKKKRVRAIAFVAALIVLAVLSVLIRNRIGKETVPLPDARKTYYVQFDFSELRMNSSDGLKKNNPDTVALSENLLAQIITVLNPDSVVTESELMKSFSRAGKLYSRRESQYSSDDAKYFRDTLGFDGALFIKEETGDNDLKDSVHLSGILEIYEADSSVTLSGQDNTFSIKNIENEFRNNIQDMIMSTRLWTIQGYVLSSNDTIVLFRTTKGSTLRTGAVISYSRRYINKEGVKQRLKEIEKRIEYYKGKSADSSLLRSIKEEYAEREKELLNDSLETDWSHSIAIEGKVLEMYDTTGKATWKLTGQYPYERPEQGDLIYFKQGR